MLPHVQVQDQHRWLTRLVGDWTFQTECSMGPDQPSGTFEGTETIRSLGDIWVLAEGEGGTPEGSHKSLIQLGFDTVRQRFVGTFASSMMTELWHYEGSLDAENKVLTLDTEGPKFSGDGRTKYHDIITVIDDNHHTLSAEYLDDDGKWVHFMTTHYYRKK